MFTKSGNVSLDNILLVDNNLYSYALQLENGIPVQHFYGDKNDTCLLQLMHYLTYIKQFDSMAQENDKVFQFRAIYRIENSSFIDYYYSDNMSTLIDN